MSHHWSDQKSLIWGIVGGLGPFASTEFLGSIYESWHDQKEQDLPVIYLLSDPSYPDRSDLLRHGNDDALLSRLVDSLDKLLDLGANQLIICCVTMHVLLDRLPSVIAEKVISLTDITMSGVLASECAHLLVCTDGSRRRRVFESHPLWYKVKEKIVLPDDNDQAMVHAMIYQVKMNKPNANHIIFLNELMAKYRVRSFIAGCTDLHVLAKRWRHSADFISCLDPLAILAAIIRSGISPSSSLERPDKVPRLSIEA